MIIQCALCKVIPVFRIRMDPVLFADPDPDLKNPDPNKFIFALIDENCTNL